jgi:hypothetical protein
VGSAGVPLEQRGADLLLESADLAAESGLGQVQRCGGASEVLVLGDSGEAAHEPQIQIRHEPRPVVVHTA